MDNSKFPMLTGRYMDPEELDILKDIHHGRWKTKSDLEAWDAENPGFMADFAMLSTSGYCGWLANGTLVLTESGNAAIGGGK